ncbi:hypothetical protein AYO41_05460 [Verrucomicrobia bacterium SCGC AG-212-E04]|nr:hypothetical protein AYO41_05460 [Verrucomicrobia bacterium SCGC AG-212-E04]
MKTSAESLKRLAQIPAEIAALKAEFRTILDRLRGSVESAIVTVSTAPATGARRGRKRRARQATPTAKASRGRLRRSPLKGKKRPASPSGPLAPAVVSVLKSSGKPQSVNSVLEGLKKAKYVFTAKDPKKNLAARIYKLSGVKQVGPGLFAAK